MAKKEEIQKKNVEEANEALGAQLNLVTALQDKMSFLLKITKDKGTLDKQSLDSVKSVVAATKNLKAEYDSVKEVQKDISKNQKLQQDIERQKNALFKQGGEDLKKEIEFLLENKIIKSGEYQLPDALRRLTESGNKFKPGKVEEWLDCGNKEVTVHTNQRVLEYDAEKGLNTIANDVISENAVIISPCYIGENVKIVNSIVGPHVSIGKDSVIENSIVKNTIIQNKSSVINALLQDSMIGNQAKYQGSIADISLGDFSTIA